MTLLYQLPSCIQVRVNVCQQMIYEEGTLFQSLPQKLKEFQFLHDLSNSREQQKWVCIYTELCVKCLEIISWLGRPVSPDYSRAKSLIT